MMDSGGVTTNLDAVNRAKRREETRESFVSGVSRKVEDKQVGSIRLESRDEPRGMAVRE